MSQTIQQHIDQLIELLNTDQVEPTDPLMLNVAGRWTGIARTYVSPDGIAFIESED